MPKKIEATGANCGLKHFDFLTGNQKGFSVSDYAEIQEKLQSNLIAVMKPSKVIRLHRCFACEGNFTTKKMSSALVICKACYASATAEGKGKIARNNFVEKALNNFQKFLRRRVSA